MTTLADIQAEIRNAIANREQKFIGTSNDLYICAKEYDQTGYFLISEGEIMIRTTSYKFIDGFMNLYNGTNEIGWYNVERLVLRMNNRETERA